MQLIGKNKEVKKPKMVSSSLYSLEAARFFNRAKRTVEGDGSFDIARREQGRIGKGQRLRVAQRTTRIETKTKHQEKDNRSNGKKSMSSKECGES